MTMQDPCLWELLTHPSEVVSQSFRIFEEKSLFSITFFFALAETNRLGRLTCAEISIGVLSWHP